MTPVIIGVSFAFSRSFFTKKTELHHD